MAGTVWIVTVKTDGERWIHSVHDTMTKANLMFKILEESPIEWWAEIGEYVVE